MRAALVSLLAGIVIAAIVYVATGRSVLFLPLVFLPLLLFWPRRGRDTRGSR